MATKAISGIGAFINVGQTTPAPASSGGETYDKLGEVLSIAGPNTEKGEFEVTHLESAAKEYLADLPDNGSIDVTCNYVGGDAAQDNLRADAAVAGNTRWFQVIWGDGFQAEFVGEVLTHSWDTQAAQSVQLSMSIKISGAIAYSQN